jgi:hypothetical protein
MPLAGRNTFEQLYTGQPAFQMRLLSEAFVQGKDDGEVLLSYYSLGPRLLTKSAAVCIDLHRLAQPRSVE